MSFLNRNARFFENIHIVLWLLKDTFWLLEFKVFGTLMIVPTIFVAVLIALKTIKTPEFNLNISVCCWITANAFWMICEFYSIEQYKILAIIPFLIGLVFSGIYYFRKTE